MHPLEAELRRELPQAVLRAIGTGHRNAKAIAQATNLRVGDVERSIKRLVFVGAIKPVASGSRDGYELTPTGRSVVAAAVLRAVARIFGA